MSKERVAWQDKDSKTFMEMLPQVSINIASGVMDKARARS
jgi:hypothetical protein